MSRPLLWNPALQALPMSGIRRMFNLAAKMEDVVHLSIGQPDFPTPEHIIEAHVTALREGKTRYTMDAGLPDLLEQLARYYGSRYQLRLSPDNFLETTGGSEAFFLAISSVVTPASEVIVIEPSFVLFEPLVRMLGAQVHRLVTGAENGYQVDPQAVIDAIHEGTSAIILNSPGNPTGAVYPASTIRLICQEAHRRGVPVISDEVYDRLVFDDEDYASVLRWTPNLNYVMVVGSFSKSYSMPGMRIGWLASGKERMETLRRYHMYTTTVGNTPGQWAAVAALRSDQRCVTDMVRQYRGRRDRVVELVAATPHFTGYQPGGAFYIMPSLPPAVDGSELALRMLQEIRVCTIPGDTFGESCRNALRLSYATATAQIEAAFERMIPWLEKQSF